MTKKLNATKDFNTIVKAIIRVSGCKAKKVSKAPLTYKSPTLVIEGVPPTMYARGLYNVTNANGDTVGLIEIMSMIIDGKKSFTFGLLLDVPTQSFFSIANLGCPMFADLDDTKILNDKLREKVGSYNWS